MPRRCHRKNPWRRRLIAASATFLACASAAANGRPGAPQAGSVDAVARRYQLAGEVLVARGDRILLDRGYGTLAPGGGVSHRAGERWRLASITKQVTAALIIREATRSGIDSIPAALDLRLGGPGPLAVMRTVTTRQLLTHHSGLANPDATPVNAAGVPAFYRSATPDLAYCASKPPVAGAPFAYNNCDYLIAAAQWLKGDWSGWPAGMAMAKPGERGVPGFVAGKPEQQFELASWGAAGGLIGTARAVFRFDRSLMTMRLMKDAKVPEAVRDELWKPEGNGSYQALGQWVFLGRLNGCAAPKRIVQRDGEIFGVQARNFIFPDDDLVVIVFTNRSSDDFALGEVWEGKGFVYDLLSAAACS